MRQLRSGVVDIGGDQMIIVAPAVLKLVKVTVLQRLIKCSLYVVNRDGAGRRRFRLTHGAVNSDAREDGMGWQAKAAQASLDCAPP